MLRKSLLLAAPTIIVALVACGCKSTSPQASTSSKSTTPTAAATPAGASAEASCSDAGCATGVSGGRTTALKIALKFPKGWKQTYAPRHEQGRTSGCPATQMSRILGVQFASAQGCVIGQLQPGGAAEKAGLKVGDSIKKCNGGEVECLSTLDPLIWTTQNDTAELVIARDPAKAKDTAASGKTSK